MKTSASVPAPLTSPVFKETWYEVAGRVKDIKVKIEIGITEYYMENFASLG